MSDFIIAKVAVENTAYSFDMLFDYSVPDYLCSDVVPGKRVLVPFGNTNKKRVGIVFSKENCAEPIKKLKSIYSVIDDKPLLTHEMLRTSNYIHDMCFCTYFDACKLFLPHGLLMSVNMLYAVNPDYDGNLSEENEKTVYEFLQNKKNFVKSELIVSSCKLQNVDILEKMVGKGILLKNIDAQRKISDATIRMVELIVSPYSAEIDALTKKQKEVVRILADVGVVSVKELCYFTGYSSAVISALENKKIIRTYDDVIFRKPYDYNECGTLTDITLSEEQSKAYSTLIELFYDDKPNGALLFGVTGSGKTQVYLKLIDDVLKTDRGIIVMIPEISLTPQMLSLFYSRYGEKVAVFHSALSLGQRLDEWKRVKNGDAKIAIGTRSAVFAPFDDIGLVIIDEEQEHTYKSEMSPRYSAKDVARYRVGYHKGLLVFSSATPSVETYTKALNNSYSLLKLENRFGDAMLPDVEIIDTVYQSDMVLENISQKLANKLKENYSKGNQSILLLNRRGYNTYAHCTECGTVSSCPNCSISLTYHIKNGRLMCHYCGYSLPFSNKCSNCNNDTVKFSGSGTQKLEEEISMIIPEARVLRMDTDTTSSRFSFEKNFNSFGKGEYDILVGTQMVAKGLDFPNVTLVGVLNIDQMLYNDDYKSGERAFDLITQVVGRSGRGKTPGKAYIQTSFPESEIVTMAKEQDYDSFYNVEMPIRKVMIYPPFCDLCVIGFSSDVEYETKRTSLDFLNQLKKIHSEKYEKNEIIVLGPVTPRVSKLGGKYRERIIIKCKNSSEFRKMISELLKQFAKDKKYDKVSIYADINPESVL